jgi:hypothetical protein
VTASVTHFEIYAEHPPQLAEFYQSPFPRLDEARAGDTLRSEQPKEEYAHANGD